jgi:hypothetical protein
MHYLKAPNIYALYLHAAILRDDGAWSANLDISAISHHSHPILRHELAILGNSEVACSGVPLPLRRVNDEKVVLIPKRHVERIACVPDSALSEVDHGPVRRDDRGPLEISFSERAASHLSREGVGKLLHLRDKILALEPNRIAVGQIVVLHLELFHLKKTG